MPIPLLQVDAFTSEPYSGNPAAVCLLRAPAPDDWMQSLAAEMNLSETSFIEPRNDGSFSLRWLTPTCEVDLCGHGTLAAAHAVWDWGLKRGDEPVRFHSRSGELLCRRDEEFITMDFPACPPVAWDAADDVSRVLGRTPTWVGRDPQNKLIALLEREEAVRGCAPDFRALAALPHQGCVITAPSDDDRFDFVSRFFAPAVGVDEDPVCGSAHCALGPFWAERLSKSDLMAHQISARRGVLRLRVQGDRVELAGRAVTVLKGEVLAEP